MGELIYENSLANSNLVKDFILEGQADISFDKGLTKRTGEYPLYHHGDMAPMIAEYRNLKVYSI